MRTNAWIVCRRILISICLIMISCALRCVLTSVYSSCARLSYFSVGSCAWIHACTGKFKSSGAGFTSHQRSLWCSFEPWSRSHSDPTEWTRGLRRCMSGWGIFCRMPTCWSKSVLNRWLIKICAYIALIFMFFFFRSLWLKSLLPHRVVLLEFNYNVTSIRTCYCSVCASFDVKRWWQRFSTRMQCPALQLWRSALAPLKI